MALCDVYIRCCNEAPAALGVMKRAKAAVSAVLEKIVSDPEVRAEFIEETSQWLVDRRSEWLPRDGKRPLRGEPLVMAAAYEILSLSPVLFAKWFLSPKSSDGRIHFRASDTGSEIIWTPTAVERKGEDAEQYFRLIRETAAQAVKRLAAAERRIKGES